MGGIVKSYICPAYADQPLMVKLGSLRARKLRVLVAYANHA